MTSLNTGLRKTGEQGNRARLRRARFHFLGDIDDYHLTGSPGQEFNILAAASALRAPIHFMVSDAATGTAIDSMQLLQSPVWSPTMRIPASGIVRIRACGQASCARSPYNPTVSYWFVVNRIDRAAGDNRCLARESTACIKNRRAKSAKPIVPRGWVSSRPKNIAAEWEARIPGEAALFVEGNALTFDDDVG